MGCVCVKNLKEEPVETPPKVFSWDVRRSIDFDARDYIIENVEGREILRRPGTVNGQQMIIQNCKNAFIVLLDLCNTVTIDDCVDSTIILGAVKSSVFLRNCTGCTCITACGQFRARDSRKCSVYIHCETQPIIEASTKIKFGDFFLAYRDLPAQLKDAALNILRRDWADIHDFTPVEGESNWTFIESNWSGAYTFYTRSEEMQSDLNALGVTWKGKGSTNLSLESTV